MNQNMSAIKTMQASRLQELIAARKKARELEVLEAEYTIDGFHAEMAENPLYPTAEPFSNNLTTSDKYGNVITYNDKQQEFVSLATTGKSCILIGPAGTGKTTAMRGTVQSLIQSPHTGILTAGHGHKFLPNDVPGIVICAYTRRATNNIRRNMDTGMQSNCITIHKLLEYTKVYESVMNEQGEQKTKMAFEPSRHRGNPLPTTITTIIFEESSMISTELFAEITDALSHPVQFIFLGDIQQLPPVFGPAILGFKLLELPVVELTEVYRQALESPIIRLAHRVLSGKTIPESEFKEWAFPNQLTITAWKKKVDPEYAISTTNKLFCKYIDSGFYNPETDMILIPYNKSFGTLELNKYIANYISKKNKRTVYEVQSGFLKHYFSVGDQVLFDRADATIMEITPNPVYTGKTPAKESIHLDYHGHYEDGTVLEAGEMMSDDAIDAMLIAVASDDDRTTHASHQIKLYLKDSDTELMINKSAQVNTLLLSYTLTVHKSQGSEWNKVFLLFHNTHNKMIQRELLYTAITRAAKELFIICEADTFVKGIENQRIKGDTLAEKAEFFKGKLTEGELMS